MPGMSLFNKKVPRMQITNMHCSGQTVSLAAGDYHATIVTVGAGLAELTFQGCHLVIPHKPEEMPLAHLGKSAYSVAEPDRQRLLPLSGAGLSVTH